MSSGAATSRPPQAWQGGNRVDLDLVEAVFAVGAGDGAHRNSPLLLTEIPQVSGPVALPV
jgi:hypothetical protein